MGWISVNEWYRLYEETQASPDESKKDCQECGAPATYFLWAKDERLCPDCFFRKYPVKIEAVMNP